MSELVVVTFEDTKQAGEALKSLKMMQHEGLVKIDDAAVGGGGVHRRDGSWRPLG